MDANTLDFGALIDSLGAGLLIFDTKDKLVYENVAAQDILGNNLPMVRMEGWAALAMLVDASRIDQPPAQEIRTKGLHHDGPVRFSMLLAGSYTPCWISNFKDFAGQPYYCIMIDRPDWTALTELMGTFRSEAQDAITNTAGHADFVRRLLTNQAKKLSPEDLSKKSMGMIDLISREMFNLQLLMGQLHRLEIIRTGQLADLIANDTRKINIEDFLEDFVEDLSEQALIDPTIDPNAYRDRLVLDLGDALQLNTSRTYLGYVLRDMLRNAFLYSEAPSLVTVQAIPASQGRHVEISVMDRGYGIREREMERVFQPFQRARQPQIIREHGYGLSLYLCKAEIEAMGGRIWFESEEGVGSTFSFKLPAYH